MSNAVTSWIGIAVGVLIVLVIGLFLRWRLRSYYKFLKFAPSQDYVLRFPPSSVQVIPLQCDSSGFVVPKIEGAASGVLLELHAHASFGAKMFDPGVEFIAGEYTDTQFVERGARGLRFFNLTRLFASDSVFGKRLSMRGLNLSWEPESARLHICGEKPRSRDRVLVLAPHPDDAEIAAFGLYSDTDATIVTVSAGDGSDRFVAADGHAALPSGLVARTRVWDSLAIPQLGGVDHNKILNLCYPDGKLRQMQADPARDFRGDGRDPLDFPALRALNKTSLLRAGADCSWHSLVEDLEHVISQIKPTLIVSPHPLLDPHWDHGLTTLAIFEALNATNESDMRFYFYANHNRRSELWPFGPAGSGVAVLPVLADDEVGCEGFYSHALTPRRQQEKFLALDAMHDIREFSSPEPLPASVRLRRIRSQAAGLLHGLGLPATSYLRRAVRPDEFFFVATLESAPAPLRSFRD